MILCVGAISSSVAAFKARDLVTAFFRTVVLTGNGERACFVTYKVRIISWFFREENCDVEKVIDGVCRGCGFGNLGCR
jgi:hypothetical protein